MAAQIGLKPAQTDYFNQHTSKDKTTQNGPSIIVII